MNVEVFCIVSTFFDGDKQKVDSWMNAKNPILGNVSPIEMMEAGKEDLLLKQLRILDGTIEESRYVNIKGMKE